MPRTTALSESNLWTKWSITQVPLQKLRLCFPQLLSVFWQKGLNCPEGVVYAEAGSVTQGQATSQVPSTQPRTHWGSWSLPEFGIFQVLIPRTLPLNLVHTIFFLKTAPWGPSWWAFSLELEGQKGAFPKFLKKTIINLLSLYLLSKKHSWCSCFLLSIICSLPITMRVKECSPLLL